MFKVPFKSLLVAAFLTIALVACTAVQAGPGADAQATQTPALTEGSTAGSGRTITVVGIGQISMAPDVAEINVGFEALSPTVSEAKSQVDQQIATILAVLKEQGIADKDIQTTYYNIYFERDPSPSTLSEGAKAQVQGNYRVSNMLMVTIRDISRAGEILDTAVEAGANQVYGVTFTVSDRQLWENQAREKAVSDAKARAEELAKLAGVEVGQVLSISEVIGSASFPMAAERGMGGGGIAPGELDFSSQIQVTFAIQ